MAIIKFEKTGLLFCLFIIILLIFLIVFSENGILDYRALKKKEATISDQTQLFDAKNRKLESEITRLKTDTEYIKHVAKHVHDMAEEDELIFKDKQETQRSNRQ